DGGSDPHAALVELEGVRPDDPVAGGRLGVPVALAWVVAAGQVAGQRTAGAVDAHDRLQGAPAVDRGGRPVQDERAVGVPPGPDEATRRLVAVAEPGQVLLIAQAIDQERR